MTTAPLTGQALRVGYQFSTGASGNADTVDGIHASATPTANTLLPLNPNAQFPGTALGSVRLSASESTDLFNNTALSVSTWTDFKANQNFTVNSSNSIVLISIVGSCLIGSTSASVDAASRVVIDSAGTPIIKRVGGNRGQGSNTYTNPFSGSGMIVLTGLSAGVHTIKTQILSNASNSVVYFLAGSSSDSYSFTTTVIEIGG
jgi:hypothetical protein